MKRPSHRFRPQALEAFETRIVPTLTPISGIPFVPPGHSPIEGVYLPNSMATFEADGNVVKATLANGTDTGMWISLVVYSAPGGGSDNNGGNTTGDENLNAQKQVGAVETLYVAAHSTVTFYSPDVSTLKLPGRDRIQCDFFVAPDSNGYAPDKLNQDALNGHLVAGQLFDFMPDTPKHGNK